MSRREPGPEAEEMLTPREACRRLGIAYSTLWKWIKEGRISARRLETGRYRIPESEVRRLLGR